jgi:hypothetical protein
MLKILRWSAVALIVILIGMQFVRPAKTNPAVDESRTLQANAQVPPEVESILKRACYDCHSHATTWPWYSDVAPVSWFVIDHVNHGRKHLNFSDWARYDRRDADQLLEGIYETAASRAMPLSSYLILHPEAKLSDADIKLLTDWARTERERLASHPRP